MDRLGRSKITGYVCTMIAVGLLVSAGIILAPSPVVAQAITMSVGVVDFADESGVRGDLLSRLATDAVVVEMSKRFDIITRSQLQQEMDRLGLRPPISRIGLIRLGEALHADGMIEGAIVSVQLTGQGAGRRASVGLVIRLLDQASGEVLNGAYQTGYSNPRVGQAGDDDTLITEAIENAAFLAVKTMSEYIIPEATVQSTIGENEVMLNRGSRDGIRRGMRLIISREREIIGYVQVRTVSPNDSIAIVSKAMRGVRPEDKARAIFDMPAVSRVVADPGTPSGAPSASRQGSALWRSVRTVLIGAAAIYLGSRLFLKDGVESVGDVTAQATIDGGGALAVEVTWDPKKLGSGLNVLEYQVYRNHEPEPVAVAVPSQRMALDYVRPMPVELTYQRVNHVANTVADAVTTVQPLLPGTSVTYYVSAVYMVQSFQGGGEEGAGAPKYYQTNRELAGQATTIQRIIREDMRISSGEGEIEDSNNVDLRRVTFSWKTRRGADRYMIEVSEDANFSGRLRFWELPAPVETDSQSDGVWMSKLIVQQLHDVFYKPQRQTLYWRVGARNSGDVPGPKPPLGRPNARWIFSQAQEFTTVEAPPPLPR